MRSAALLEARRQGQGAFPVLRVAWVARGLNLGAKVYSTLMRETAAGGVSQVTQPGGWSAIKYGSGISDSGLKTVETSVGISDPDGSLLDMLETYDPRGSAAQIDWATPGLALADWEPGFTGIVSDWKRNGLYTTLLLKTNDTVLRSPVPPGVFTRAEWGSAAEGTIYGTAMGLTMGVHDSWQVTARGMLPATNIRYDKDLGYWWLASVDQMISITRIYYDGAPQGTGGWSVIRGVYGSNRLTIISIVEASKPEKGVVVAFDCKAMNEVGGITGIPLTGPPDQLRASLQEYVYRPAPLNGWRGALPICEPTSWAAVSAFFALHKIESAHRIGGDQEPESAAEMIDSFLKAYPWVRIWWNESGQLEIAVLDPDDIDPDSDAWLDLQKHHEGGQVPFSPGDRREVYTHMKMPFMWSCAEQKYLSSYEAHDVAALGYYGTDREEKVGLVIDNPWSQCRFNSPIGDLNPAPPVDPTVPALPDAFTITLTGTGASTAIMYLVSGSTWDPVDPLVRDEGANSVTAVSSTIAFDTESPYWGGTYDLLVRAANYSYGAYNGGVPVANGVLTIDLEWPKMTGLPIAVASVTKSIGQTLTVAECFAGDPPAKAGIKGIIYDDASNVLVEDTWNGSTWGGATSAALAAYSSTIDCWWFTESGHDFAQTSLVVS